MRIFRPGELAGSEKSLRSLLQGVAPKVSREGELDRRGFLATTVKLGLVSLAGLAASNADARRGACKRKTGYRLLVYGEAPSPTRLIGKEVLPAHQLDINPNSGSFGQYVGPQDHKGKIIALTFWATWCKPCLKEFPEFERAYRANNDFVVLAMEAPWVDLQDVLIT